MLNRVQSGSLFLSSASRLGGVDFGGGGGVLSVELEALPDASVEDVAPGDVKSAFILEASRESMSCVGWWLARCRGSRGCDPVGGVESAVRCWIANLHLPGLSSQWCLLSRLRSRWQPGHS